MQNSRKYSSGNYYMKHDCSLFITTFFALSLNYKKYTINMLEINQFDNRYYIYLSFPNIFLFFAGDSCLILLQPVHQFSSTNLLMKTSNLHPIQNSSLRLQRNIKILPFNQMHVQSTNLINIDFILHKILIDLSKKKFICKLKWFLASNQ